MTLLDSEIIHRKKQLCLKILTYAIFILLNVKNLTYLKASVLKRYQLLHQFNFFFKYYHAIFSRSWGGCVNISHRSNFCYGPK